MNKWLKSLIEYSKTGTIKACPFCGKANVQIENLFIAGSNSVTFHCTDCDKWAHFDGVSNNT